MKKSIAKKNRNQTIVSEGKKHTTETVQKFLQTTQLHTKAHSKCSNISTIPVLS